MAEETQKMIIPDDVKNDLKEFCNNHGIEIGSLKDQFRKIYFDQCKTFPDGDGTRARHTKNALKAIINVGGGGMDLDGFVLHVTYPLPVTVKKGTKDERVSEKAFMFGIFKADGHKRLLKLTVWDNAIDMVKKIPFDKIVRLKGISMKESEEYGKQYTFNNTSAFQVIGKEINSVELIQKVFKKKFVDIEEFEMKPSKDRNDTKFVKARIKDSNVATTKKGNTVSRFNVYSDKVSDQELMNNPDDHTVMIQGDVSLAKYKEGSLAIFAGQITPTTKEYSSSMFCDVVIPITSFEKNSGDLEDEIRNAKARAKNQVKESTKSRTIKKEVVDEDLDDIAEDIDLNNW